MTYIKINYRGLELEVIDGEYFHNGVNITDIIDAFSSPAKNKAGAVISHDQALNDEIQRQIEIIKEDDKLEWKIQQQS